MVPQLIKSYWTPQCTMRKNWCFQTDWPTTIRSELDQNYLFYLFLCLDGTTPSQRHRLGQRKMCHQRYNIQTPNHTRI
jgi:hypothetical protein